MSSLWFGIDCYHRVTSLWWLIHSPVRVLRLLRTLRKDFASHFVWPQWYILRYFELGSSYSPGATWSEGLSEKEGSWMQADWRDKEKECCQPLSSPCTCLNTKAVWPFDSQWCDKDIPILAPAKWAKCVSVLCNGQSPHNHNPFFWLTHVAI